QAVGDIAAGAVDVDRDRLAAVVGELAEPLDAGARGVLLDVANEIDVAELVALLLAELRPHGLDQLDDKSVAQLTHRPQLSVSPRTFPGLLLRRRAADRRRHRGCGRATAGAAGWCRRTCAG